MIDEVVKEPFGGGHRDPQQIAGTLKEAVERHIKELETLPIEELLKRRYEKFRKMGSFAETGSGWERLM